MNNRLTIDWSQALQVLAIGVPPNELFGTRNDNFGRIGYSHYTQI
jgi:hypothetical protein